MSENRIRHFRHRLNLTQDQLAAVVDTSAATISRLETENMTISLGWLRKLAQALDVNVSDLLGGASPTPPVHLLGTLNSDGMMLFEGMRDPVPLDLEIPATRPVAVQLSEALGLWRAGEILIGDRIDDNFSRAVGRDCLVQVNGGVALGRLLPGDSPGDSNDYFTLAPPDPGRPAHSALRPDWIAPVVMRLEIL